MLPEYAQARKAIWDAVNPHTGKRRIDEAFPHEVRKTTRDQDMQIVFLNGSTWQVVGSDSYDRLVGATPCGIVWSEWALANPSARAYLRPIIAENNGWQLFITTPRGRNHAHTTLKAAEKDPNAFAQVLDAIQTGVFTPEQLELERAAYIAEFGEDYGLAKFEQEYLCSFDAANIGSILARSIGKAEREGRVGKHVEYDPDGSPIEISADLGRRDTATWWFWQPRIGGFSIVDYDGGWGMDADEWCDRLESKLAGKQLGKIWLPHDARQKSFAAKRSALEIFIDRFGAKNVDITPQTSIPDRINAARVLIGRCEFSDKCERGIDGLRAWSYDYNEETKIFSQTPKHDWACLTACALVMTPEGEKPINALSVGDDVITPMGARKVCAVHEYTAHELVEITTADGRVVTCTPNHKWFTSSGLIDGDGLRYNDILFSGKELSWTLISLISMVFGITDIHRVITELSQRGSNAAKGSSLASCIGIFGKQVLEKSLTVMKYIMPTETKEITQFQICGAFRGRFTSNYMGPRAENGPGRGIQPWMERSGIQSGGAKTGKLTRLDQKQGHWLRSNWLGQRLQNGMEVKPGKIGTQNIQSESGKTEKLTRRTALFAVRLLLRTGRIEANTAGRIVRLKRFESVTPVYDLTVEGHHCYIANGVLSSNSHDGDGFSYGCVVMQQTKPPVVQSPIVPKGAVTVDQFISMSERTSEGGRRI